MKFSRGILTRPPLLSPYPLQLLENKLLDIRYRLRGDLPVPDGVVIAAIDEKSLESLGRWPWDRHQQRRGAGGEYRSAGVD